MALIIMGKTCSGKTRVVEELVNKHGFHKIVTTTTRSPRDGEIDGVDYNFMSNEKFNELAREGYWAEWQSYQKADEGWVSYGSPLKELQSSDDKSVIILTPKGVEDIKSLTLDNFVVYLYANETTLFSRLHERNSESKFEIGRRLEHDRVDFKNADLLSNKIVYNSEPANLDDVVNRILELYEDWLCKKN